MSGSHAPKSVIRPARWREERLTPPREPFQDITSADYALVYGPTPKIGSGKSFPAAYTVDRHSHERDQILYSASGMLTADTDQGSWLLPPGRALWIPNGMEHSVRMVGPVLARSLFTEPSLQVRASRNCEVIVVSPLLHSLLMTAYTVADAPHDLHKRLLMAMLMMEVRRAPTEALSLAIPTLKALAAKCRRYIEDPTPHETIDTWCDELGMSRRTFTRLFRRETGQSFADWRQKVCLFAALPRLEAGETVTAVAFSLGYSSPAAFTSMFRRVLGATPRNYLSRGEPAPLPAHVVAERLGVS